MSASRAKVAVLTGATGAIGWPTALELARAGYALALVARDRARGEELAAGIRRALGGESPPVEVHVADLERQKAVRRLATNLEARHPAIGLVVHNAGIVAHVRRLTEDGIESQLAVNALAPFLLTGLLAPCMAAEPPSRVIVVASRAEKSGRIDFDDLDLARGYDPLAAYGRSKLAATLFAYGAARRYEGRGVAVHALHPGVVESRLLDGFTREFARTRDERAGALTRLRNAAWRSRQRLRKLVRPGALLPGTIPAIEAARTILYAATSPDLAGLTGCWIEDGRISESSPASRDRDLQERWWAMAASRTASS
jgi:NAD(P)-dependent dehydrogenase (short-subunit alcohol dehydrogenase family)